MEELNIYVKACDDMCFKLREYRDHAIVVEFMCGPKDEYYNITIYSRCEGMGKNRKLNTSYLRIMNVRYDWTCHNNEDVKEDEIFAFANKMIDAYISR